MKYNFRIIRKEIPHNPFFDDEDDFFFDSYSEYIRMKCLQCDYEEDVEADILLECCFSKKLGYPIQYCPHCNHGDFIPKDVYCQLKGLPLDD